MIWSKFSLFLFQVKPWQQSSKAHLWKLKYTQKFPAWALEIREDTDHEPSDRFNSSRSIYWPGLLDRQTRKCGEGTSRYISHRGTRHIEVHFTARYICTSMWLREPIRKRADDGKINFSLKNIFWELAYNLNHSRQLQID